MLGSPLTPVMAIRKYKRVPVQIIIILSMIENELVSTGVFALFISPSSNVLAKHVRLVLLIYSVQLL
jgi:hypothetical protein